ncbi:MAG: DUF2142 domain-containing protein, partial [Bacteroidota bacterium]
MSDKTRKNFLPVRPEWLLVIIGLVLGWSIALVNPPFHSNDEDRHFLYAYSIAQGDWTPEVRNNKRGVDLPENLVNIVKSFQGIPFHQGSKIPESKIDEIRTVDLEPSKTTFYSNPNQSNNPLPYIPAAVGVIFGKFIDSNPIFILWSARVFSLFAYLALLYLAVRVTPVFKNVFMLAGLMPMALFQAASVTYDVMVIASSFLLVAYILRLALDDRIKRLRFTDYAAIIAILLVLNASKEGYFLLGFLFFIIPYRKINNIVIYILMIAFIILTYKFKSLTWNWIMATAVKGSTGQAFQKDFAFGGMSSIFDRLEQPFEFIGLVFQNILHFKQEWAAGIIGRFGYSYTNLPTFWLALYGIVLLIAALTDGRREFDIKPWQKL